jgi:hypothetical protein
LALRVSAVARIAATGDVPEIRALAG